MPEWGYAAIGVAVAVILLVVLIVASRKQKNRSSKNLVETKDARYTYETDTLYSDGEAKVSYTKGDFLLNVGTVYKVGKNQDLKPGKYTILTTDQGTEKFNIRVGDYVREYTHNQEIVLADNSEITAVSHPIILR